MKILVLQPAFIGDVVLALPVVQSLHQQFPEAEIHLLVRKGNEGLAQHRPDVHHVWVWDKGKGKLKNLLVLARELRACRFDYVINLHRFVTSGLFTVLAGSRESRGFDKNPLSWLFTRRFPHTFSAPGSEAPPLHDVDRNLSLIRDLVPHPERRPRFYLSPAVEAAVDAWIQQTGAQRFVTIAPASVWFTKQFPAHKWVELIRALPPEMHVCLLGAKGDFAANEQIVNACGRAQVHNLAGKLSFQESACLMQRAVTAFVNDSAPLHFASAVNARTVAVFCSTIPEFGFFPLSDNHLVVETPVPLDCRPCGIHGHKACPKGHFACAEQIPVAALMAGMPEA